MLCHLDKVHAQDRSFSKHPATRLLWRLLSLRLLHRDQATLQQLCVMSPVAISTCWRTGVVPATLGVLNASFNKLRALPLSLGSAPVLQQMYLANNQ